MKFQDVLIQLWDSRAPRERILITIAAVVIIIGSLYAGIVDPAITGNARLKTSLPEAQARLANIKILAAQVQAMPKIEQESDAITLTQANLQTSLKAINIDAVVSPNAPWHINIRKASGDALLTWLRQYPAINTAELKRVAGSNSASAAHWQGSLTISP